MFIWCMSFVNIYFCSFPFGFEGVGCGIPVHCLIYFIHVYCSRSLSMGWSGGAMVLGKLPVPGRPTVLITVGQGPIALAVGAGGGGLDIFTLIYPFSSFSLSLGDGPI